MRNDQSMYKGPGIFSTGSLLVWTFFAWMVAAPLFRDGMFVDGMQYAVVAKNFAHGKGSWWHPQFSETLFHHFHQQPVGYIWMESLFFKVFGNSIYPERIFSLLMGIIIIFLVAWFWRSISQNAFERKITWLPQLLLLSIPTVSWGLRNNVTENTMVIFDLLAVIFLIRALTTTNVFLNFIASIVFLSCAAFTKGLQSLFPLATPLIYWFTHRTVSLKKMVLFSLLLAGTIMLLFFLLMMYPPASKSFEEYFHVRLKGFPHTPTETTANREWLPEHFLIELSIPLILVVSMFIFKGITGNKIMASEAWRKKEIAFMLLTAVSASFPLMIAYEQRTFYLITSTPYYATAAALFLGPSVKYLLEKFSLQLKKIERPSKWIIITAFCCAIVFGYINAGTPGRDADIISDVKIITGETGMNRVIAASPGVLSQWSLYGYFQRYGDISLASDNDSSVYFVTLKINNEVRPSDFEEVNLNTKYLQLLKKEIH